MKRIAKESQCDPGRLLLGVLSRRQWLNRAGSGMGMLALANLLIEQHLLGNVAEAPAMMQADELNPLKPKPGHFNPKATSVIWLFMEGAPILNLNRHPDVTDSDQRAQLNLMAKLNEQHLSRHEGEAELVARIQSFELAYRMQTAATSVVDISEESQQTLQLYGIDRRESKSYGTKCLMARRLIENGVRFVQVYSDGEWDAHNKLTANHTGHCLATDVPIAGLLTDLEQRGLLSSTLVIWGGEFGRMPMSQNGDGRDHNPNGFLQWMAGAGIRGGTSYGETDDIGYAAVTNRVSVNDLHATLLHLLGIDHKRLTYFHNGRSYRLTDVADEVIRDILS